VFLIFKEAVNNALRHSDCEKVVIELKLEGSSLVLVVADDGGGFDTSESGEGNGLASMRSRALALGGELRIKSDRGLGTTLTLIIPVRHRRVLRPT
jgi:signal transduction histidine kinase